MNSKPSLYLVGDSISIHYHPFLAPLLAEHYAYRRKGGLELAQANLDAVQGANGGDSDTVLAHLRDELRTGLAESLVVLNCGLHDIKRSPETGNLQVSPDQYRANLEEIIRLLRGAGKNLLWISTTPLDEARHLRFNSSFHRREADLALYNRIAAEVMHSAQVPMLDLHAFTLALPGELYIDHVHFLPDIRRAQAGFLRREFDRILRPQVPRLHSFLGDSITDAGRDRSESASLGTGYVQMLAERHPALRFRNLGVSGNRLSDLRARLEEVPLESQSLTLYGGINDVVHIFKRDRPQSPEEFEADADALLAQARRLGIPLRLMTPFLCEAKTVETAEPWWPMPGEQHARWRRALAPRLDILRRLCRIHDVPCIELDPLLAPLSDVSIDGVHPNEKGHRLIADHAFPFPSPPA